MLSLAAIVLLGACNKKNDTTETIKYGKFAFHLHTNVGDSEVEDYGENYLASNGDSMSLDFAQLYISGIQLVKLDGSLLDVPKGKMLKDLATEAFIFNNVPVGNYKAVRFKVGLDATTNALASTTPSDSTILNHSEMWFGNTSQPDGYIFANIQGKIDTSYNHSMKMADFSYKVGTNAHYVEVQMPDENFSIMEGSTGYAHMIIDYSKIFDGVDITNALNLQLNSVSDNGNALATKIAGNLPGMFHFE